MMETNRQKSRFSKTRLKIGYRFHKLFRDGMISKSFLSPCEKRIHNPDLPREAILSGFKGGYSHSIRNYNAPRISGSLV